MVVEAHETTRRVEHRLRNRSPIPIGRDATGSGRRQHDQLVGVHVRLASLRAVRHQTLGTEQATAVPGASSATEIGALPRLEIEHAVPRSRDAILGVLLVHQHEHATPRIVETQLGLGPQLAVVVGGEVFADAMAHHDQVRRRLG